MSASSMFIQLAVAALMGSVLMSNVIEECFDKVMSAKKDRCRLAQDAIKCYGMNITKTNFEQTGQDMNLIENNFERWGCPGRENIRYNVCKNAVINGTYLVQESERRWCLEVLMKSANGEPLSAVQKGLTRRDKKRYRRDHECEDTCKKIMRILSLCRGDAYRNNLTDCERAIYTLSCFEKNTPDNEIKHKYGKDEHEELSEWKSMKCSDCSEIKIRESSNKCKELYESYKRNSASEKLSECFGAKFLLICFERVARCRNKLPLYWLKVREELSERKKTICSE